MANAELAGAARLKAQKIAVGANTLRSEALLGLDRRDDAHAAAFALAEAIRYPAGRWRVPGAPRL